jgi:NAD(P)-dependent dehydrogenase (short-subunit alcohol dehydrogenase family)
MSVNLNYQNIFKDRVYLITGAAQGIGRELIKQLYADGAAIFFTYYKDKDHAVSLMEELGDDGTRIRAQDCDAREKNFAKEIVKQAIDHFGHIDGLVNNAGYKLDRSFALMTDEEWEDQININLNSVYAYSRAVIHPMLRQQYGRIINMGAISGTIIAGPYQVAYGASKSALIGFTKSLAWELGSKGINVNIVTTGMANTAGIKFPEKIRKVWAKNIPCRRLATATEVASLVKYMLSPLGDYITGQNFIIDGGMSLLGFTNFKVLLPDYYHGDEELKSYNMPKLQEALQD